MAVEGVLLFTNASGGGSGTGSQYEQDVFNDVVLAPTTNSGFSSTLTTNPLGTFFADDLAPKWMSKTLWVKDLVRVDDRSLWINGRATYKIVWNENFPGADGYVFGSVSVGGTAETRWININDKSDGAGVAGLIRQSAWIVKPTMDVGTNTADLKIDGSTISTASFASDGLAANPLIGTKTIFGSFITQNTNSSDNIHNHQIVANQNNNLRVYGVIVYYNVSGDGIRCDSGNSYVNKTKVTATGSTISYPPSISNILGGIAGVYLSSNGSFGVTTALVPSISAAATGSNGSALLSVALNTGTSFLVNSGIYIASGTSNYFGQITNQSGDVLTISPVLPYAVNSTVSTMFQAGISSTTISKPYYQQAFSYQPEVHHRNLKVSTGTTAPLMQTDSPLSYSDPYLNFRFWGGSLMFLSGASITTGLGPTLGIWLNSAAYFEMDGKYSALEFEFMAGSTGCWSATLVIDGMVTIGVSYPISGPTVFKQQILTNAGIGWHQVKVTDAGSTNILLSRITGYLPSINNGASFGLLATIPVGQTFIVQAPGGQNASLCATGNITRYYPESLRYVSNGVLGPTTIATGGLQFKFNNTNEYFEAGYFGTRYAISGNMPGGASISILIDGVQDVGATNFNNWYGSGLTLGFHTIRCQFKVGTAPDVYSLDVLNPASELSSVMETSALTGLSNTVRAYSQPYEPSQARVGDIWEFDAGDSVAYQKMFGGWQRVNIAQPYCVAVTAGASISMGIRGDGVPVPVLYGGIQDDPYGMLTITGATLVVTIPSDGLYYFAYTKSLSSGMAGIQTRISYMCQADSSSGQFRAMDIQTGASFPAGGLIVGGQMVWPGLLKKGAQMLPSVAYTNGSGATIVFQNTTADFFMCQRIGP